MTARLEVQRLKRIVPILLTALVLCAALPIGALAENGGQAAPAINAPMLNILEEREAYTVCELSFFPRNGLNIYAELYLPNEGGPAYPTVLLAHGFAGTLRNMEPYAQALAENGFAACVFDFCGGSNDSRSDGDTRQMSVLTEVGDMGFVLDSLLASDLVDKDRLYLMGESQGGLVAALLAAQRAEEVCALVLLYPALAIPENARAQYADAASVPETAYVFGTAVGRVYYTDVLELDAYAEIAAFTGPVLLIHGSADIIVPLSCSQRAAEVYADAELTVLDGAGHGFYDEACASAASEVVAFLREAR